MAVPPPERLILLVEDNADDEALTLRALKEAEVRGRVVVAHDGLEALRYLFLQDPDGAPPLTPTMILLDLRLPRMDGLEVLRRVRLDERTARIPIVILTASTRQRDALESEHHGVRCIQKPVDFGELVASIRLGLSPLLQD